MSRDINPSVTVMNVPFELDTDTYHVCFVRRRNKRLIVLELDDCFEVLIEGTGLQIIFGRPIPREGLSVELGRCTFMWLRQQRKAYLMYRGRHQQNGLIDLSIHSKAIQPPVRQTVDVFITAGTGESVNKGWTGAVAPHYIITFAARLCASARARLSVFGGHALEWIESRSTRVRMALAMLLMGEGLCMAIVVQVAGGPDVSVGTIAGFAAIAAGGWIMGGMIEAGSPSRR